MERRRRRPRERWLLTRKTWKYMADAGRRLVPDGAQNRAEDVPRIEAYFQKVCSGEQRFLLWRKSSYPGALPKPRKKRRPRSASVRGREPGDTPPPRPADLLLHHTSGGRFDIAKLRRDFFNAPPPPSPSASTSGFSARFFAGAGSSAALAPTEEEEDSSLVDLLRKYLKIEELEGPERRSESDELVRALNRYLRRQAERTPADGDDGDSTRRTLQENLGRYYGRSPNRDHIVQDLLTDRNLLKRLYHDLRKTKPYRGGRLGGSSAFGPGYSGVGIGRGIPRTRTVPRGLDEAGDWALSPPLSPPPLIEVYGESLDEEAGKEYLNRGTQTLPVCEEVLLEMEREYRVRQEALSPPPTSPSSPPTERRPARRRSSVDHDDVSQSVSDTIKRYLRMARKKSVDADKADRFKRINYDKNLRNIKPRAPSDVDDDGPHKGCQTDENWIVSYRESGETCAASLASSPPTSPPSPVSPTGSGSFLHALLGRAAPTVAVPAGGMQKSRSSSSVVHSVSKRLWRTRSRSSSRVASSWTPQGSCCWSDGSGRCVRIGDSSILTLTDVERRALQQAALARLQQLNIGTPVKIPEENAVVVKPKRRAHLLKRKALTTGFFDQSRKDADKDKESSPGNVFGVPLAQCVEAERALRRQHGGSRASLASLTALDKADDSESCDSGDWSLPGLEDAGGDGPKVPGLVSACLAHLRRHIRTKGLFRVSASIKRVRQLREEWESGAVGVLEAAAPHDVATLLKEFLRDLPDPLLCRDLYTAFLHTQKIRNRRLQWEALRLLIQLLPAAHRDTLSALLQFLSQLAAHCDDDHQPGNKMDAANLATILAPNILHKSKPNENATAEELSERTDVINVVRLLIEKQAELWALPGELLHEAYIHLAHHAPAALHALLTRRAECAGDSLVSREQLMHAAAAVNSEQPYPSRRTRSGRETSDTSSESMSSAMTVVTRLVSGVSGSSGVCRDHDDDSASEYPESTLGGSDDDCVITASLHIPAAFPPTRPAAPPRRRSSGSDGSAPRDSAVGSSTASVTSSPPASPPPAPLRVTMVAGDVRREDVRKGTEDARRTDIDTLLALGRERNTSDARAVVLRQHDETNTRTHTRTRQEHTHTHARKHDAHTHTPREERRDEKKEGVTLYKRGELISSARSPT